VSDRRGVFTPVRFLRVFLFCQLALLAVGNARGQNYVYFGSLLEEIDRMAKWQVGPFRISSYFQIRNLGYDSNIYQKAQDNDPVSDYTAAISLPSKFYINYRNGVVFSLAVVPEYAFYATYTKERSFNYSLLPELRARLFGGLIISAGYEYGRSRRRATSEFDVRAEEKSHSYRGSVFIETARLTALGFSGYIQDYRYEDIYAPGEENILSRRLNRQERRGSLEFYYRVYSDTVFFLSGGYAEYNFQSPASFFRNSYSYQVFSGLRFPLLGRIRGALTLGYKSLRPRTKGINGFSGLIGDTSFNLRLSRFQFRVIYRRDCYFSFSQTSLFFVEGQWGAGISFYPTSFLRLDYDYRSGRSDYPGLLSVSLPDGAIEEIERQDRNRYHIVSLVYRVVGDIGIGLTGNFWQRRSNFLQVERERFFVGAFLTYEF
jgi:hypothetical protein